MPNYSEGDWVRYRQMSSADNLASTDAFYDCISADEMSYDYSTVRWHTATLSALGSCDDELLRMRSNGESGLLRMRSMIERICR